MSKFTLSTLEVLEFALEGVQTTIGANTGNPGWLGEDYAYHLRAKSELERRIKIAEAQEARKEKQK